MKTNLITFNHNPDTYKIGDPVIEAITPEHPLWKPHGFWNQDPDNTNGPICIIQWMNLPMNTSLMEASFDCPAIIASNIRRWYNELYCPANKKSILAGQGPERLDEFLTESIVEGCQHSFALYLQLQRMPDLDYALNPMELPEPIHHKIWDEDNDWQDGTFDLDDNNQRLMNGKMNILYQY